MMVGYNHILPHMCVKISSKNVVIRNTCENAVKQKARRRRSRRKRKS